MWIIKLQFMLCDYPNVKGEANKKHKLNSKGIGECQHNNWALKGSKRLVDKKAGDFFLVRKTSTDLGG